MDYRLFHATNVFVAHHPWVGTAAADAETFGAVLVAIAAFGLWLLARPGGNPKWKLASASALTSAAVALLAAQVVSRSWHRNRPFVTHPGTHTWGSRPADASFPSDHAAALFAIAITVLVFDQLAGALFLAGALVLAAGRVLVGVHYPGDVLGGALLGTGAALVVVAVARPAIGFGVRLVERVTDPVVTRLRRGVGALGHPR